MREKEVVIVLLHTGVGKIREQLQGDFLYNMCVEVWEEEKDP